MRIQAFKGWRILGNDEIIKKGDWFVPIDKFLLSPEEGEPAAMGIGRPFMDYIRFSPDYGYRVYRKHDLNVARRLALSRTFSNPLPLP